MDTVDSMVVPGPSLPEALPDRPKRFSSRWLVPLLVLILVVAVAASSFTLPYYAVAPGSARQVNDLIQVPQERAFPPRGKFLLTTVFLGRVTPLEAFTGWLKSEVDVVPAERVLGPVSKNQFSRYNRDLMNASKETAVVVALRHLGFPVPERGQGGLVGIVENGSPAEGRLKPGDVIVGVDGRSTQLATEVVDAIRARKPGERVRLDVREPTGTARAEEITLTSRPGREAGFLGVSVMTKDQSFDYPFEVKIGSADIGGPSAGLAFTLGVLDTLTPGELTGEKRVAATGTMELDGRVGEVGGVAQKVQAVKAARIEYFLVPPGEFDEAVANAGKTTKIVRVASLSEALAAVARLGGDVSILGASPRPRLVP